MNNAKKNQQIFDEAQKQLTNLRDGIRDLLGEEPTEILESLSNPYASYTPLSLEEKIKLLINAVHNDYKLVQSVRVCNILQFSTDAKLKTAAFKQLPRAALLAIEKAVR